MFPKGVLSSSINCTDLYTRTKHITASRDSGTIRFNSIQLIHADKSLLLDLTNYLGLEFEYVLIY